MGMKSTVTTCWPDAHSEAKNGRAVTNDEVDDSEQQYDGGAAHARDTIDGHGTCWKVGNKQPRKSGP